MGSMIDYISPVGFYFTVRLLNEMNSEDQKVDATFQEVTGISAKMQSEEIKEGSENRFTHNVPGRVRYENLVLKRGLVVWPSDFGNWCKKTLQAGDLSTISNAKLEAKTIMLELLDPSNNKPIMSWSFVNALPLKWDLTELNTQDNAIAIETLTLTYQYFETFNHRRG